MLDFNLISIIWLLLIIILFIVETATINLVTIWFAFGAIIPFVISLFYNNIIVQITLFLVISLVLLVTTKPISKKIYSGKTIKTNYDKLIGEKGVALENFGKIKTGYIKVNGMEWLAKSDEKINNQDIVLILSISGAKLKVKKY
ncbi:MAG: NfeD family protein [Bacilli bacterium]